MGKGEVVRSLGTRDPDEAKRRHATALVTLDAQWANLLAGPKELTEREAHSMATPLIDEWIARHRENPSEQVFWDTQLFDDLWAPLPTWDQSKPFDFATPINPKKLRAYDKERWCEDQASAILTHAGLSVSPTNKLKLAKAVAAAMQRSSLILAGFNRGESDSTARSKGIDVSVAKGRAQVVEPVVKLDELVEGWATEKHPAEKTAYEWKRVARQLSTFLGHQDANLISLDDLVRWKTSMIEAGLRPKTIRDAQLAPIRAIFKWAVENRRLPVNPATGVTIAVKPKAGEERRSFTDDEAKLILRAASKASEAVRRWVPWICAYTGARVSEVCQLRKQDVLKDDGVWCIRFDPAAGSLKTVNSERTVPVHPALEEYGFLSFAQAAIAGPLFPDLKPDKWGNRGGNGTKVLGKWVRSLGLIDPRLAPNHSWRHRLRTSARRYDLAVDIVDAITGHARTSIGDRYGEYPIRSLHRELSKLPDLLAGEISTDSR